jgi:pimeloyl-ACP methyl ester carboxylesterase
MVTTPAPDIPAVADLAQGRLEYRAAGPADSTLPPVVFVHGVLVDGRLWEPVAARLAAQGFRSYALTLPLGAHRLPMNPGADLSPRGIAQLVRDFMAALGLNGAIIVGNDTGGAICQVLLGGDTSRVGAAVLTNCDAFACFPPRTLAPLFWALRHPGLVAGLVRALRSARVRRSPLAYGLLTTNPLDDALTHSWVQSLASKEIRRDLAKLAQGVRPRVLLDAASRFDLFAGPVRIVWGDGDRIFAPQLGRQLSQAFPEGSLTLVPGGRTFLPLEYPAEVASEVTASLTK